jgi:hypothetical protein
LKRNRVRKKKYPGANFTGEQRHKRWLQKVEALEKKQVRKKRYPF